MSQKSASRSGLRRSSSSILRRPHVQRQLSHEEPMVLSRASSSPSIARDSRKKAPITTGRVFVVPSNDLAVKKNRNRSFSDDPMVCGVVRRPSSLRRSFRSSSSGTNIHQLPTYLEVDVDMEIKKKQIIAKSADTQRSRDLPKSPQSGSSLPERSGSNSTIAVTTSPGSTPTTKGGKFWVRLIGVLFLILTILQLVLIHIYLKSYHQHETTKKQELDEASSSSMEALDVMSLEELIPSSSSTSTVKQHLHALNKDDFDWWTTPEFFNDENIYDIIGKDDGTTHAMTILIIAATLVDHRYLAALWSHLECAAAEDDDKFVVILALPDWSRPVVEPMLEAFVQRNNNTAQQYRRRLYRYYLTYDRRHVGLWCDVLERIGLAGTTTSTMSPSVVLMSDRIFSLKQGIVKDLLKIRWRQPKKTKKSLHVVGIASFQMEEKGERSAADRTATPPSDYFVEDSIRAFLTPTSLASFWEHSCSILPTHASFGINLIGTANVTALESTYQEYHERDLFRNSKVMDETNTLGLFSSHPTREWIQQHPDKNRADLGRSWNTPENFDYWKSLVESDAFFPLASTELPRHVSMDLSKKPWLGWCTKGVTDTNEGDDITTKFQGWMSRKPEYLILNNLYQPISSKGP